MRVRCTCRGVRVIRVCLYVCVSQQPLVWSLTISEYVLHVLHVNLSFHL